MFWTIIIGILAVIALGALITGIRIKRKDRQGEVRLAEAELEAAEDAHQEAVGKSDRVLARELHYQVREAETKLRTAQEKAREGEGDHVIAFITAGIAGVIAVIIFVLNSFYTQDVGESKVQVSWGGNLVGQTTDTGLHFKWPWVSVKTFDVRNNVVSYIGGADEENVEHAGNPRTGPQITFQDREGVSGNMDVTVRYSLDPKYVTDIYSEYRTQDALVSRVINEAVRAEARESTVTRETIEVFNERGALAEELRKGLEERIRIEGFIIEDVAIQEIKYPATVEDRFNEAQAARIEIDRAEAAQQAAMVEAQTRVIEAEGRANSNVTEAEGQAEANRLLSESLTDEILRQRYIDALNEGTTFVVPEGSDPLVSVNP